MHANTMVIAKRYATALFESLESTGRREAVLAQVEKMLEAFPTELDGVLLREAVSGEVKLSLAKQLAEAVHADQLLHRTLELMGERKRLGVLRGFLNELRNRLDKSLGIERVEYRSATPVTDADREILSSHLSKSLGGAIRLKTVIEPDLIAGCVIRINHRVADLSLRSRLIQMKEVLSQGV